jgi:hypothetical protein
MMNKLQQLLSRCKGGVYLIVNEHRDCYTSAEDQLKEIDLMECPPDIDDAVRAKIIETNTIIDLQFYPDTPIGSYSIIHHDLDTALDMALECVKGK